MFDSNDYLNSLFNTDYSSTTTTETETDTQQQTTYSPQTGYSASSYEKDDYSSAQNFTEQQSYDSYSSNRFAETEQQTSKVSQMHTPMIEKSAPVVNLVKSRARIRLETRMKIVLSVFSVIVACLLFVSIFNFITANKLEASFAGKQQQINELEMRISASEAQYNIKVNDGFDEWVADNDFTPVNSENTKVIRIDKVYKESTVQEVPTNWFNDVCEFFSKLFA